MDNHHLADSAQGEVSDGAKSGNRRNLIPADIIQRADKVLFLAHLALGDFAYMQNCFRAFAKAYPHVKIHLWVEEIRRTKDVAQWEGLRKYFVYDWVNSTHLFAKVYDRTYSPNLFNVSMKEAQAENYPLVVSFATHRRHFYARLIRNISPGGFVVGQKKRVRLLDIRKHLIYRKLNATIRPNKITKQQQPGALPTPHVSSIYADWFYQLFDLVIPESERYPYVDIPEKWRDYAQRRFADWGLMIPQE